MARLIPLGRREGEGVAWVAMNISRGAMIARWPWARGGDEPEELDDRADQNVAGWFAGKFADFYSRGSNAPFPAVPHTYRANW